MVNYAELGRTPESYCCLKCRKTGVKLWHKAFNTALQQMFCADCTATLTGRCLDELTKEGRIESPHGGLTSRIGQFVPAIPAEDTGQFHSYKYTPRNATLWWESLSNFGPQ